MNAILLKIPVKKFIMLCLEFLQYGRAGRELFCLDFFVTFFSNEKKLSKKIILLLFSYYIIEPQLARICNPSPCYLCMLTTSCLIYKNKKTCKVSITPQFSNFQNFKSSYHPIILSSIFKLPLCFFVPSFGCLSGKKTKKPAKFQ